MSATRRALLECRQLDVSVPGRLLLRALDATFAPGRVVALIATSLFRAR